MLILSLRTDKPEAEIGLYNDKRQLAYETWQAHRQLAETIHLKIRSLLKSEGKTLDDLGGIAIYKGPGSFTGLRIGISVANALADGLGIPIVGGNGNDWISETAIKLSEKRDNKKVSPDYGAPPHVTRPKH